MHRTPCTRSQPLCKYLPSIASRRRTDTLTPFVYTTSLQILTFNSVAPQNGHFSTIRLHNFDHLQSKDHVETATGIPISQTIAQTRTFVCVLILPPPLGNVKRKKAIFPRQKIIFSARKNLLYTGARLSYILCYNIYFSVSGKSA